MGTTYPISRQGSTSITRFARWRRVIPLAIALALALSATVVGPAQSTVAGDGFTMRVPVLMYHRITCAPPDATLPGLWVCPNIFRRHLQHLKANGWTSVTADDVAAAFVARERLGRKRFVISLDDGNRDGYTNVFPILESLDMVATFYMVAGKADWPGHLTWDQMREMHAAGHDIANHSMTHANLAAANQEKLFREIEMSQRRFEAELGYRPTTLCYPYGSHDADARARARASGFVLAFTTAPGARESTKAPLRSPRLRVSRGESAAAVLAKVQPYASGR